MSRKFSSGVCVAAMLVLLAGCGGGSASSAAGGTQSSGSGGTQTGGGGTGPQSIQGIATPSSVSVVTAN